MLHYLKLTPCDCWEFANGDHLIDVETRGGGYSHTLPIRVCAAQRGRDFEAPDLERGIIFRTHESSSTPGDYEEAFI